MPRILLAIMAALVTVLWSASTALADSPHFLRADASVDQAGNLVCSFKEAGLGNTTSTEAVTCSAQGTATYACINGGGNHPQAANKETVSGPVSASGDFPVRNGQTTGTLVVSPPSQGSFSCPPGQRLVLASVSYSEVTLSGAAGDTAVVPGTFSRVLVPGV
jgi:hypothetical protein